MTDQKLKRMDPPVEDRGQSCVSSGPPRLSPALAIRVRRTEANCSAASVDGLVETYPNYFGDVSLFVQNLKQICLGKDAIEYHMAPQKLAKPKPEEKPDPTLLFRRYTRWNDPSRK